MSEVEPNEVGEESSLSEAEGEESILEPAVQLSTEDNESEQNDANFFPFDSLAVELNEDLEETAKVQENEDESSKDESINTSNVEGAVADSTVPGSNESSQDGNAYEEDVTIKEEPIDPNELQKTNLEDFIYSTTSANYEEDSNSMLEDSKEEGKKALLYRFPKVVKAVEVAEYETLQVLYQLFYQRSAWDTQEILKQRILECSGFNFDNNSEEYFNREMMLRTQPNDVLIKIGQVLYLDQVRNMYGGSDKARLDLIIAIMQFLASIKFVPKRKRAPRTTTKIEGQGQLLSKCGCRSRCLGRVKKFQRHALLQYVKELEKKELLDSYLFNLMEIKKNERKSGVNYEDSKKIREVAYQYRVKLGPKMLLVCKGAFAIFHGLKQSKLNQLQVRLKSGTDLPQQIDMNDFPPFILPQSPNNAATPQKPLSSNVGTVSSPKLQVTNAISFKSDEEIKERITNGKVVPRVIVEKFDISDVKGQLMPYKRRVWEEGDMVKALISVTKGGMNCAHAGKAFNIPRSTLKRYASEIGNRSPEEFVKIKVGQTQFTQSQPASKAAEMSNGINSGTPEKNVEEVTKSSKVVAPSPAKKKLRDFPLVVTAIESASNELLIDVHFVLFLSSAEGDQVKENILDFTGFTFDNDTEEYDERSEFLQRMSFKIVGEVARSFSLAILESKEETIKNILAFLSNPDESYLTITSTLPLSLSDVELDDIEGFSDSDESITCEVVEKKRVECIDLISSGEESDKEDKVGKIKKTPKKTQPASTPAQRVTTTTVVQPSTSLPITTTAPAQAAPRENSGSNNRTLRDFETICKIVNTHPHEYLVDIYDLLYLQKYEPDTLRNDILDFTGFEFEKGTPEYVKRKQLLDRMLYNSVRRIYNTLIHNTTEVKVFSKPTMITEIFQFLFKLPDHDTSVRPPPVSRPALKPPSYFNVAKTPTVGAVVTPPSLQPPIQTGKLSDLKRVFQRVACFPCEYLIDVHKLLFMTDCDPKVIRQNIFAFKGFKFGADTQEFQQRKMYLEYLTFHSLRKISSVLTTRSVDLRNSTKHELATHLTQVLAEYCNTDTDADASELQTAVTSSSDSTTAVETIIVTPTIDPAFANPPETSPSTSSTPAVVKISPAPVKISPAPVKVSPAPAKVSPAAKSKVTQTTSVAVKPKLQSQPQTLSISIVDTRSISSPAVTTTANRRKRKSVTVSKIIAEKKAAVAAQSDANQFADIHLPEIEQYRQIYGQNLNTTIYNPNMPAITGITTFSYDSSGIPQTFPMAQSVSFPIIQPMQVQPSQIIGLPVINQIQTKKSEVIVPGECEEEHVAKKQKVAGSTELEKTLLKKSNASEESATFHNKISAIGEDDEDCDKPLASLIGHPIDSVLKNNIVDIVEQTDLQDITINGVIQKIYGMYPKFDLAYRKEFIKSTVRSMLYKLGEQKNSDAKTGERCTDSPDCSVTTTDIQDNSLGESPENTMECS